MISQNTFKNLHRKLFLFLVLLLPTQLGFHFWPDWASVFGIRVDYLSPTVYLTDVLVVGILISWMASLLHGHMVKKTMKQFSNIAILIFAYLGVTSLAAHNQPVAIYKLIKLIEFSLLGFYVLRNWKLEIGNWKFRAALCAAMLYSSAIAWAQFLAGHTFNLWLLGERTFAVSTPGIALVNIGGVDYLRPYATFPHPNVLAGFLLVGILLLLAGPVAGFPPRTPTRARPARLLGGPPTCATRLVICLSILTLITTFSHSVWLAGIAALFFLKIEWFAKHTKIHSTPLSIFALSSVEGAKIFTQIALLSAITMSLILPMLTRVDTSILPKEIGKRVDLARVSIRMVSDFPLTGVGLGNFIVRLPEYGGAPSISWWLQPVHNVFLLVLSETGLIGFGLFVWSLLKIVKLEIGNWKLEIAFLVILMTGMSDHYWLTLQQGQLMATIVFAATLATIKR